MTTKYIPKYRVDNKQLQYKYCPISQEVKFLRLTEYITKNIFLRKSYRKLVPDSLIYSK